MDHPQPQREGESDSARDRVRGFSLLFSENKNQISSTGLNWWSRRRRTGRRKRKRKRKREPIMCVFRSVGPSVRPSGACLSHLTYTYSTCIYISIDLGAITQTPDISVLFYMHTYNATKSKIFTAPHFPPWSHHSKMITRSACPGTLLFFSKTKKNIPSLSPLVKL